MPRYPRKNTETSYLHIMTQGINKSYIFNYQEDIKLYIKYMYELKEEHNINIIAYCIMKNHAHILVEVKSIKDLSKYMQRLNTKYGKYYNLKYNRVGFVFRNRYKSEGIYDEEHLYNCIKYIYDNPVQAGICKNASEYPFSNYRPTKIVVSEDYVFLETNEERETNYNERIEKFMNSNNIQLCDLRNDFHKLKELIIILRDKYNMSFRAISKEIQINREKVRKIYYT